ncbi:MAG TPA: hypothetical protein VMM13_11150, partial [Euzebya sp.]|nr:hypothetical protein [Euzebya sp.]
MPAGHGPLGSAGLKWGPPPAPISPRTGGGEIGGPTTGQRPTRGAYDLQAGVVEVRPLRFTDILDGSFSLFRATMGAMVAMVLAIMVPLQLLSAFLQREALSFGFSGLLDDQATADLLLGEAGV